MTKSNTLYHIVIFRIDVVRKNKSTFETNNLHTKHFIQMMFECASKYLNFRRLLIDDLNLLDFRIKN